MLEHLQNYTPDGVYAPLRGASEDGIYRPHIERVPLEHLQAPASPEENVRAAANAVNVLSSEAGLTFVHTEKSRDESRDAFAGRAPLPNPPDPAAIVHLRALLDEYDHDVVHDAAQLRRYVTNRLLAETEDKSPGIRLRALEMLGKITEVGLFSERTIVTIENKSDSELQQKLRENLAILLPHTDFHEVKDEAPPVLPSQSLEDVAADVLN